MLVRRGQEKEHFPCAIFATRRENPVVIFQINIRHPGQGAHIGWRVRMQGCVCAKEYTLALDQPVQERGCIEPLLHLFQQFGAFEQHLLGGRAEATA